MTALPRLLVLIGSGELAAQMTRGHRTIVERLTGGARRPSDVSAAIIDTPYGFQSNADALSDTLVDYFGRRIGMAAAVASYRRADDDALARELAFERIAAADFVFSGPGSPSYALRQWLGSPVPGLISDKLTDGGAVVFASAAALTLGRFTVPVYEIYKGGSDPYWLRGMDVLATIGIDAAVLPHYDNTEGAGHDTRFCFLGERRLAQLEESLPDDAFVLGIDEHTAILIDIDAQRAFVHGRGGVTLRRRGVSEVIPSGEIVELDRLRNVRARQPPPTPPASASPSPSLPTEDDSTSLARRLLELESRFAAQDRRARLVEPLVEVLLELRRTARADGDYETADLIRDRLAGLGIEVKDSSDGSTQYRLPSEP